VGSSRSPSPTIRLSGIQLLTEAMGCWFMPAPPFDEGKSGLPPGQKDGDRRKTAAHRKPAEKHKTCWRRTAQPPLSPAGESQPQEGVLFGTGNESDWSGPAVPCRFTGFVPGAA